MAQLLDSRVLGPRLRDPVDPGPRILGPGSWIQDPGSCKGSWIIQDRPGSRIQDLESLILDPGYCESRIEDPGCRILDPGSWNLDPGSWVLDP